MFVELLKKELLKESGNYYPENPFVAKKSLKTSTTLQLKRLVFNKPVMTILLSNDFLYKKVFLGLLVKQGKFGKYLEPLEYFYSNLSTEESRNLLVRLVTYRILGFRKVRLPLNIQDFLQGMKDFSKAEIKDDCIDIDFFPWKLPSHYLKEFGFPYKVYINASAGYRMFVLHHYVKITEGKNLGPEKDDVVIDLGGCYGETAIFFSHLIGERGKVYSFEFIPGNISIYRRNLEVNNLGKERIEIIEHPVWDSSGKTIYYKEAGVKSKVTFEKFEGNEGESSTITVDDFVEKNNIQKLDFIKTDIEGAEPFALKGAVKTLAKFKPKLAISIYHNLDDFTGIIRQINELNIGYKFYLGHYTPAESETVLFCCVK
jgi:FkbM family methyltransferase